MPTDTNVNNLIINKLTKAQYEAIQNPSETELYLVPDVIDAIPTSGSTNFVTSGGIYAVLQEKVDTSDLATVATSGSYNDLDNKPTIPAAVTESTVSGWGFTKNAGTITGITMNGSSKGTSGVVDLGTVLTSFTETDPTVPAWAKAANKPSYTAAEVGALPNTTVIPAVNDATLTIQKNGTTVNTFTANASSNVTANIQVNELPTVSSSDNGKILQVVNGAWALVTPVTVYTGTSTPDNSQGNDGDLYLQTS